MGNNACGCGSNNLDRQPIVYEVSNSDWADAVNSGNLAGVKMLHQSDPDVINEYVTLTGHLAIHVAVDKPDWDLFRYLLRYTSDINCQCGDTRNSLLHLAVMNKDLKIIQELFNCDIDDELINNECKTAEGLISETFFRRRYIKIKNSHKYKRHFSDDEGDKTANLIRPTSNLETSIGGLFISNLSNHELKKVIQDSLEEKETANTNLKLSPNICNGTKIAKYMTSFGQDIGCEVDEIAFFVRQFNINRKLQKLWDKWVKKSKITKLDDLFKLVYGLTVLTLRNKEKQNGEGQFTENSMKPKSEPIKHLTALVYTKFLPKYKPNTSSKTKKKRKVLTRQDFMNNFHTYLYNAHDLMVTQENQARNR